MDKNELAGSFSLALVILSIAYVFKSSEVIYGFIFSVFFGFALVDKKTTPGIKIMLGLAMSAFVLMIRFV